MQPSSASYTLLSCQTRLRACLHLFSPLQQPVGLAHGHPILSRWQHHSVRTPSPYSSWYSLSSSRSRLRPHTSQSATAVSPFFLSRESLGDSVLPVASPYQPTTSDVPFVSLHVISLHVFSPHFICLLGTPRISYVSFLAGVVTVSGAQPYGHYWEIGAVGFFCYLRLELRFCLCHS